MAVTFENNFKELAAIPIRALRAKKIIVLWLYLILAFIIYNVFTYLALILGGASIRYIFDNYGFVPFALFPFYHFIPKVIFYLGAALSAFAIMLGLLGSMIFDFEEMRGNRFLNIRTSLGFTFRRLRQLFLSEIAIIIFVAFIVLLGIIVGVITRIPYLGEWLYAIFFLFPNFVAALFTVLIIFILALSVIAMPAAVAADLNGDTFNSLLEAFSAIIRRPLWWFGITIYSAVAAKVSGFIFGYFSFRAIQFLKFSTAIGGGDKISGIISDGMSHLPVYSSVVSFTNNIFPGVRFGFDLNRLFDGGTGSPAGYVMTISLFLIFLLTWAYTLAVVATGQAYAYTIIRKSRYGQSMTDEKSLLERASTEKPSGDQDDQETLLNGVTD